MLILALYAERVDNLKVEANVFSFSLLAAIIVSCSCLRCVKAPIVTTVLAITCFLLLKFCYDATRFDFYHGENLATFSPLLNDFVFTQFYFRCHAIVIFCI